MTSVNPPRISLTYQSTVCEYVERYAQLFADRVAVVDVAAGGSSGRWTYAELAARMHSSSQALREAGVYGGCRVAFFGFPGASYAETLVSTMQAGAIYVGLNPKYTAGELRYVLEHAEPALVLVDSRCSAAEQATLAQAVSRLPIVVRTVSESVVQACAGIKLSGHVQPLPYPLVAGQSAAVVYTSGTTGMPKGAVIRSTALAHEGRLFAQRYLDSDVGRTTRVLNNLPVNHIGCIGDLTCAWLVMAATIVFMPRFSPKELGQVLQRERVTFYFQVPAMFQLALAEGLDLSQLPELTDIGWGGAPCPQSLIAQFASLGFKLSNTYGLSEGTGTSSATRPDASMNELASGVGIELEAGTVRIAAGGEIQLRGDLLFAGYLKDEAATAAAFTPDGWFRTGDLGELDSNGNTMLAGRMKDMFKSGGYNIYPREVEQAIESVDGVELAAVLGVSDPVWTEVGHAFVIAEDRVTADYLHRELKTRLANYKIPKHFTISADLPRLPVGKIDRQALLRSLSHPLQ